MNISTHPSSQLNAAVHHVFKLGLDIDRNFAVTAIQCKGARVDVLLE